MSWYTRLLKQTATYWAPTGHSDGYGTVTYAAPTTLTVRWEDRNEKFLGPEGRDEVSASIVWTNQDVEIGGYMLLGTSSATDPENTDGAYIIRRFDKIWDVKGRVVERRAILTTIRSVNMTVGT